MKDIGVIILGMVVGYVLNEYIKYFTTQYILQPIKCLEKHHDLIQHMLIEVIVTIGFYLIYRFQDGMMDCMIGWVFLGFGIILAVIDFEYMILPTRIIEVGVITGLILKALASMMAHNSFIFVQAVLAGVSGYILFQCIYSMCLKSLKKEALGFGDVRLMGMLGVYCGLEYLWLMIGLAAFVASLYGIIQLLIKKDNLPFPLGPFLNMATFSVLIWGQNIMTWYVELIIM